MRILDKLENMNVGTKTAEQLTENQMSDGITSLGSKVYWANEYEITGAASHYIQDQNIDGIIIINAFGCGPDSLMVERISRYAKEKSKPFLNLSIDEQTGEAGFVTRIEAFTDMLLRKKTIYKKKNLNDLGNDGSISLEIMNGIKNAL
jgi:predicted nucleotide-binding protein (sugar kinase/HSP70/actin superfamily)